MKVTILQCDFCNNTNEGTISICESGKNEDVHICEQCIDKLTPPKKPLCNSCLSGYKHKTSDNLICDDGHKLNKHGWCTYYSEIFKKRLNSES